MEYNGNKFRAYDDRQGNITVTRLSDNESVFLQGDDTIDLRESLETLDTIAHPSGPFATYEQHLDAVLDVYDVMMRE